MSDIDTTDNASPAHGPWTCPSCQERVGETFHACWNCGTTRDGEKQPAFQLEVQPISDCRRCGYLLQGLTSHTCPECGALIGPDTRDTPIEPLFEVQSDQDHTQKFCLWLWVASWTVVPVVIVILTPMIRFIIRDEEQIVSIILTLRYAAIVLAVFAPILFFYNMLPSQRR